MKLGRLEVSESGIASLCAKWGIARLEAFGSVLRDDFQPDSDVDLLVTFGSGKDISLFDLMEAEEEFETLIGRKVDLVPRDQLKWVIRDRILGEAQAVFSI